VPEGYSLLVGAPKIGKSWLSLSIALAVSSGGYMFGKIHCWHRPVLLLALEDSDRRMQDRLRKLQPTDPIWPESLTYLTDVAPSDVIPTIEAWLIEIPRSQRPLVILDTIGKVIPPALQGESQYQRDYRFSSSFQKITQQRPGMALIGLHHDRKASSDDFVESISGTNGIAGAADTLMVIDRPRNEPEGWLQITGRDVEEETYGLRLTKGNWDLMGDDLRQAAKAARTVKATTGLGERSAEIIEFVSDHPDGVRADDIVPLGFTPGEARVYLSRLYERGRLARPKRGLYAPLPTSNQAPYTPVTSVTSLRNNETQVTGGIDRARAREDDLGLIDTCSICGEEMVVIEEGQTTHPGCEPEPEEET
jgi:hypothetical protein